MADDESAPVMSQDSNKNQSNLHVGIVILLVASSILLMMLVFAVVPSMILSLTDGFGIYTDRNYAQLAHKYRAVPSSTGYEHDPYTGANQHIGESRGPPLVLNDRFHGGFSVGDDPLIVNGQEGFSGGCDSCDGLEGFSSSEAFITKVTEVESRRGVKPPAFGTLEAPTDLHNVRGADARVIFHEDNLMHVA
jgi:hypothetical protein